MKAKGRYISKHYYFLFCFEMKHMKDSKSKRMTLNKRETSTKKTITKKDQLCNDIKDERTVKPIFPHKIEGIYVLRRFSSLYFVVWLAPLIFSCLHSIFL